MANQPITQNCGNCRYFQARAIYKSSLGEITYQDLSASCKRHPPTVGSNSNWGATYPFVDRRQWCGEWSPSNPENIDEGSAVLARLVLLGDLTAARALADKLRE